MWIKVRTMDGKKSFQVDGLSKLTKIEELRESLVKDLEVPPARQRLFFAGRQLEDGSTLFDYRVERNSLIQVMIRPVMPPSTLNDVCKEDKEEDKENSPSEVNCPSLISCPDEKPASNSIKEESKSDSPDEIQFSHRWKVNDFVDAKDTTMGAWFEGTISKVTLDENQQVQYHVFFDGYDENEISLLGEKDVRPRARKKIPYKTLEKGMIVMANYNCDEPKERGFWYDVQITRKAAKGSNKVYGQLLLGKDNSAAEECCIIFVDELFAIESSETPTNVGEVDEQPEKRKVKPDCDSCRDDPRKKCKDCGCYECGGKDDPSKQLMCDECDQPFHMRCLNPPMVTIPEEDEWYCPLCKNDGSSVIKAGEKQKASKKKANMASSNPNCTRDWGKGMACVGRTKICSIVPPNHFGPIPGVAVGSCWKFRVQASEAGVHRPHVAGIAGRANEGAYSIVLAGGYEDDTDDGDQFTYTGSGGRDLSGNKRTAEQSFDQTLTKFNLSIARNCDCAVDTKNGGEGKVWNKGKPLRVLRSYKFGKHSKFAPEEGIRYDGIYKVVKYWPEKGQSGFIVWRYRLRRDDPTPAPWTKAGKAKIAELGLEIQYPEGYLEAEAKKAAEKEAASKSKRKRKNEKENESEEGDGGSAEDAETSKNKSLKKAKIAYTISAKHQSLIAEDKVNQSIWKALCENPETHAKFLHDVEEKFLCICCQEVVFDPVTVECTHSTCKSCLSRAFKAGVFSCPSCRFALDEGYQMVVNTALKAILVELFPGYEAGR